MSTPVIYITGCRTATPPPHTNDRTFVRHHFVIFKMAWRKYRRSNTSYRSGYRRGLVSSLRGTPENIAIFGASRALANPLQRKYRRAFGYRGNGLYGGQGKYSWGKFGRDLMRVGRKYLPIAADAALGASPLAPVWSAAKPLLKPYIGGGLYGGQGSYQTSGNVVSNALIEGGHPSMDIEAQNDETETIVMSNCESVLEIFAPTIASGQSQFALQTVECNPGLHAFSRKLSAIAKNYVHYKIKQLVFEIRPLISESNVNNGITGTMMAAFLYDANQNLPESKDDMLDLSGAVSGRIVDHLKVGVECDPEKVKDVQYIVRTCPVPLNRDVDEYDHGRLVISTNNIPSEFSNKAIAELYVYYTVELRMWKPDRSAPLDYFVVSVNTLESAASLIGNNLLTAQQNSIGGLLTSAGASSWTYTFPANYSGIVEVIYQAELTGSTRVTLVTAFTGNVSALGNQFGSPISVDDSPSESYTYLAGSTGNIYKSQLRVRSASGNVNNTVTVTFTGGAGTGTFNQQSWQVREISDQLFTSRTNPVPVMLNNQGIQTAIY